MVEKLNKGDCMKRRFIISLEIVVLILVVLAVNWAFRLLNQSSNLSVAEGIAILLMLFIFTAPVVLSLRDRLHHPRQENTQGEPHEDSKKSSKADPIPISSDQIGRASCRERV